MKDRCQRAPGQAPTRDDHGTPALGTKTVFRASHRPRGPYG